MDTILVSYYKRVPPFRLFRFLRATYPCHLSSIDQKDPPSSVPIVVVLQLLDGSDLQGWAFVENPVHTPLSRAERPGPAPSRLVSPPGGFMAPLIRSLIFSVHDNLAHCSSTKSKPSMSYIITVGADRSILSESVNRRHESLCSPSRRCIGHILV